MVACHSDGRDVFPPASLVLGPEEAQEVKWFVNPLCKSWDVALLPVKPTFPFLLPEGGGQVGPGDVKATQLGEVLDQLLEVDGGVGEVSIELVQLGDVEMLKMGELSEAGQSLLHLFHIVQHQGDQLWAVQEKPGANANQKKNNHCNPVCSSLHQVDLSHKYNCT